MRIAYLAPFDLRQPAGHSSHVVATVRELSRKGHRVSLLARGCPDSLTKAVHFVRVPGLNRPGFQAVTFSVPGAAVLARALLAQRHDVVYSRYFKSASLLVGIARLLGVPLIIEVNSDTDGERRANARSALFSSLERSEERAIYRGADAIIAVAEAVARATTQVEPQVENKVRIIENGVDTRLYRPMNRKDCAQKHGFEPDRRRVVYAGALQSWQGVEVLVAAIALVVRQCPDVDLLIVGDGPLRPLLERRIASAGLKRQVTIFGYTHEEVTAELIGASDVCVASYTSSAVGECESEKHRVGALMGGSPLKVYMYLACGRPVVASHLCEAGEYVQTNGAGLAVPPEDPNALSEAILQLLADPDLAQEMGARGRLLAEERHDWSIVVDKYLGVIYDAVKAPLAC